MCVCVCVCVKKRKQNFADMANFLEQGLIHIWSVDSLDQASSIPKEGNKEIQLLPRLCLSGPFNIFCGVAI